MIQTVEQYGLVKYEQWNNMSNLRAYGFFFRKYEQWKGLAICENLIAKNYRNTQTGQSTPSLHYRQDKPQEYTATPTGVLRVGQLHD